MPDATVKQNGTIVKDKHDNDDGETSFEIFPPTNPKARENHAALKVGSGSQLTLASNAGETLKIRQSFVRAPALPQLGEHWVQKRLDIWTRSYTLCLSPGVP